MHESTRFPLGTLAACFGVIVAIHRCCLVEIVMGYNSRVFVFLLVWIGGVGGRRDTATAIERVDLDQVVALLDTATTVIDERLVLCRVRITIGGCCDDYDLVAGILVIVALEKVVHLWCSETFIVLYVLCAISMRS